MPFFAAMLLLLFSALLSELSGFLSLEWRWIWVGAAALLLLAERWRSGRIAPWLWGAALLWLLLSAVAIRSWSGALDLLPLPLFAIGWLLGGSARLPTGGRRGLLLWGVAFLLLLAFLDRIGIGHPWRESSSGIVAGFFGQRNTHQMVIALLLPVMAWGAIRWSKPFHRFALAAAIGCALTPLLEKSLTAWSASFFGLTLFVLLLLLGNPLQFSRKIRWGGLALLLTGLLSAVLLFSPTELLASKSSSFLSRQEIYGAALQGAQQESPSGAGLGGFARISRDLTTSDTLSGIVHISVASGAHNHWLQAWVERGVLGLALELLFWGAALFGVISLWRRDRLLASFYAAALAMGTVHAAFDLSTHAYPETALLYGGLLGVAAAQLPERWREKWDGVLLRRHRTAWERSALALLLLLFLYGSYEAQLRIRSNRAAALELSHRAVGPGSSLGRIAQSLKIDPSNPLPRYLLIGFLRQNGAWDDAEQHLDHLEKVSGGRFPIAEERALIAEGRRDWEGVERWSALALQRNALWNNRIWALYAESLARQGKCAEFELIRQAAVRWSWNPDWKNKTVRVLTVAPNLREIAPLLSHRQRLDFLECPIEP